MPGTLLNLPLRTKQPLKQGMILAQMTEMVRLRSARNTVISRPMSEPLALHSAHLHYSICSHWPKPGQLTESPNDKHSHNVAGAQGCLASVVL